MNDYQCIIKSGKPGSNRPPTAWEAAALPNELFPLVVSIKLIEG